jgi:exodeoxyribonuclease VII large subunit
LLKRRRGLVATNSQLPAPGAVIAVSVLNRLARDLLEHALPLTWVRGEIANYTCAASGHCYFTLKDASAQVRCAMFRQRARLLDWQPANGMQVEVRALVTLYEPRGEFQLNVEAMRRAGIGALYEAFERLKSALAAEGLFDESHKRPLPTFPGAIGVVTSPNAAALRDVLSILAQRMPSIPVILYPTAVQGAGAARAIAAAIEVASKRAECDVLIVCRGGGSVEDLWAFNEEPVARAIHACSIPVVSGVGHETDFTIADFVADLRAPTPTAAAQAASPDAHALRRALRETAYRLKRATTRAIDERMQDVDYLSRRLLDPRARLANEARHLVQLAARLRTAAEKRLNVARWSFQDNAQRLMLTLARVDRHAARVEQLALRMQAANAQRQHGRQSGIDALAARLSALNPHAVLGRGYAIATDARGAIVRDASLLAAGDVLDVRLARGEARTRVVRTSPGDREREN